MSSPYASLAVFDLVSESKVAISTISITTDEVVLSGAWVLDQAQEVEIALILSDIFKRNRYRNELTIAKAHAEQLAKSKEDSATHPVNNVSILLFALPPLCLCV